MDEKLFHVNIHQEVIIDWLMEFQFLKENFNLKYRELNSGELLNWFISIYEYERSEYS